MFALAAKIQPKTSARIREDGREVRLIDNRKLKIKKDGMPDPNLGWGHAGVRVYEFEVVDP